MISTITMERYTQIGRNGPGVIDPQLPDLPVSEADKP